VGRGGLGFQCSRGYSASVRLALGDVTGARDLQWEVAVMRIKRLNVRGRVLGLGDKSSAGFIGVCEGSG